MMLYMYEYSYVPINPSIYKNVGAIAPAATVPAGGGAHARILRNGAHVTLPVHHARARALLRTRRAHYNLMWGKYLRLTIIS